MNAVPLARDQARVNSFEGPLSKLAAAFAAGAFVVVPAGDASAKTKPVKPTPPAPEQTPQPPSPPPQQFIVSKGVEPPTPGREQSLKPRDSFKECDVCPEMVVVPKGSFMMGTPADEPIASRAKTRFTA